MDQLKVHISGVCDSWILHILASCTDGGIFEALEGSHEFIDALHGVSDAVCPPSVRNDDRFAKYLEQMVERGIREGDRYYLMSSLAGLDKKLNRDHFFSIVTCARPSMLNAVKGALSLLGIPDELLMIEPIKYQDYVQRNVNGRIDDIAVLEATLQVLDGSNFPSKYIDQIRSALVERRDA
ncbi:hypothetical protein PAN31117_05051 [Pandoraea anapnoica]|uniref:Uncharacterized protein n=2 Tax=Burkholderiaceae TaxID=119060 RepID=A0A5E5AMH9_9BURK|nr:hypothetical protein PIN31009_05349 [Pandoraea iniqua]VVE74981.1 hypothetical protein PAN31117_05051 [Pandoraea anapnoica]